MVVVLRGCHELQIADTIVPAIMVFMIDNLFSLGVRKEGFSYDSVDTPCVPPNRNPLVSADSGVLFQYPESFGIPNASISRRFVSTVFGNWEPHGLVKWSSGTVVKYHL